MTFNHMVVWLDHREAHLIGFNRDESEQSVVKSGLDTYRVHTKHSPAEGASYLEEVSQAIRGALEVLVVGPGLEKLRLLKHLLQHHPDDKDRIVGVETVDHPSDAQLLAYARHYFVRADKMR